jgi:GNAT superfamily N-acetyltransferase
MLFMESKQNRPKINIRLAAREDVPDIVRLLAHDFLGSQRETLESTPPDVYYEAFDEIEADPNNEMVVVESGGQVIGTFQITYIPSLTFRGGRRAQIEAVRIDESMRGKGIGRLAMLWAIRQSREKGCRLVQLTTNKQRPEALSFYLQLGFVNSHEGLKLYL